MQPIDLITQNEYLDYQQSVNNITNYYTYGIRALTLDNSNLIPNTDYSLIQLIKDLIVKIFNDSFMRIEIINKQLTLQNDFATVNNIHSRFRAFHHQNLNLAQYHTHDLFFSIVIAKQLKRDEPTKNWQDPKGFQGFLRNLADEWMGCRVTFDKTVAGPYQNRAFKSETQETIDLLAQASVNDVPELVNFLLNKFEYADPSEVDYYLQAVRSDYPGPRVVIRFGKAICSYMQRRPEIYAGTADDIRIQFLKHSLFAIQASWDKKSLELLKETLLFYQVSARTKPIGSELYREFINRMVEKLPEEAGVLNDFVMLYLNRDMVSV